MTTPRLFEIRIPQHLERRLREAVAVRAAHEGLAFGLASHARTPLRDLLLVTEIITIPDDAYIPSAVHGAMWQGRAMLPVLNAASAGNLGIIMFHTHPHPGRVRLSDDDRESAGRLLPVFENVVGERPHASIVFGDHCVAGIVLDPDTGSVSERVRLRWLGKVIRDFDDVPPPAVPAVDQIYETQALLTGGAGESAVRRAKVAVVGLSGGGSHAVQQHAHLGVGEIAGIDGDRAERSQRSRLIGLTAFAAWWRLRKTRVMGRMVRRINRDVKFTPVPWRVPEERAIEALKASDIIVGCVDNYHARADLMEIAQRYMIPYVDIGLLILPVEKTGGITIGGDVAAFIPGGFCAWCIGHLSQEKLDFETNGRPKSYFKGAAKQAQVVSMNGVLASQAVTEVLQLLTGFRGDPYDTEMAIRKYDGVEGTLVKWFVKKKVGCERCIVLGAGDPVWAPA